MAQVNLALGSVEDVTALYAHPNSPSLNWTLTETVEHWTNQTLTRDGYHSEITAQAKEASGNIFLTLSGDDCLAPTLQVYEQKLARFLEIGLEAYKNVRPELKKDGRWDPYNRDWRFFLPLGMAVARPQCLLFFHYPPIKMLIFLQDYLNDPVPWRIETLLCHNGVPSRSEAQRYETLIDGAPIGAPDDEGTAPSPDKEWGRIPMQYFKDYQRAMVLNLLRESPNQPGYTIPVVVYGKDPRKMFGNLFQGGKPIDINDPVTLEILPGLKTAVIGANHPYNFFWSAQCSKEVSGSCVGNGKMVWSHCGKALDLMIADLNTAGWQASMVRDPSRDPAQVMEEVKAYWQNPSNANLVCALTQSQATLRYTNEEKYLFDFRVDEDAASTACALHNNDTCGFTV